MLQITLFKPRSPLMVCPHTGQLICYCPTLRSCPTLCSCPTLRSCPTLCQEVAL